jgi:hypothetical protein
MSSKAEAMKFICLVHVDPAKFAGMTPLEQQALDAENLAEDQRLLESGHLITDGPSVESKEHLGGFILIEADSREQAIGLLADSAMAKYGTLEIREHWSLEDYIVKGGA